MSNRKILVISYYWPPMAGAAVHRIFRLVIALDKLGWRVKVLVPSDAISDYKDTGLIKFLQSSVEVSSPKSFDIINWLNRKEYFNIKPNPDSILRKNKSYTTKLINWVRYNLFIPDAKIFWYLFSKRKLLNEAKSFNPDLILSSSPPPTVHLIAKYLAKRLGVKWIADFRDPWTNIFYLSHYNSSIFSKKINKSLERKVLNYADFISVVNRGFFENEEKYYHKSKVYTNGFFNYDSINKTIVRQTTRNDLFTIRYFGNLKSHQLADGFFNGINDLARDRNYKFRMEFYGMIHHDAKHILNNLNGNIEVQINDFVDHDKAMKLMHQSELLLLIIGKSSVNKNIFSLKLFDYLSARKPIIGFGPLGGAASDLLKETKIGWMLDYDDSTGVKEKICDLYEKWSNNVMYNEYNEQLIQQYDFMKIATNMSNQFKSIIDNV